MMDKEKVRTRDQSVAFYYAGFEQIERGSFFENTLIIYEIKSRLDLSVLADGSRLFIRMCPARISADRQVRTICFITLLPYISKIPI